MRRRKYAKGRTLTAPEAFAEIMAGRYVYWHDKPTHPGWARSWQMNMLIGACARGAISQAINTNEVRDT